MQIFIYTSNAERCVKINGKSAQKSTLSWSKSAIFEKNKSKSDIKLSFFVLLFYRKDDKI